MSVQTKLVRAATGTHVALYRATKGKVGGHQSGNQLGLLTTTGRRSGKARTTPVMTFPHGDGLVVVASNGGSDRAPSWYGNLVANPVVSMQVGTRTRPMTARTATAEEKAQIWPEVVASAKNFGGYQTKTSRDIPVVVLTDAAEAPGT